MGSSAFLAIVVKPRAGPVRDGERPQGSSRVLKALTVRISISVALFIALMVAWKLGWIEPRSLG